MTIKINRARKLSVIGNTPGSFYAMIERIPATVTGAITSRQLADMVDAMWAACQEAKALAAKEAIDQGAVWDARSQRLRGIAA